MFTPSRRAVLAAVPASFLLPSTASAIRAPTPIAETASGRVSGVRQGGACVFRGIPYGAPTGGAGRWLPPRKPESWSGVRESVAFGSIAPQLDTPRGPARLQSEDCLVLNVYTPETGQGRRPVMVFMHGGGFASGAGSLSDGTRLAAEQDLVVVTVNHRLNLFGFLDLTDAGPEFVDSRNVGTLDLLAALQWVQDNIGGFGGDAGNVTIFGQSGGGAKVSVSLAAVDAPRLFHRAIPMSGAVTRSLSVEQMRDITSALLRKLNLKVTDVTALQTIPSAQLIAAMIAIGATGEPFSTRLNFGPTVDGRTLPHQPCDPAAPARARSIPLLVGSTHDETRIFYVRQPWFPTLNEAEAKRWLTPTMKTTAEVAADVYDRYHRHLPQLSIPDLFIRITTEYMFARNSVAVAERKARQGGAAAYLYRFDWHSTGPLGQQLLASHSADLEILFSGEGALRVVDRVAETERMGMVERKIWAQFARTGNPNVAGEPHWPAYEETRRSTMILNTTRRVENDPDRELRSLYEVLPEFHP